MTGDNLVNDQFDGFSAGSCTAIGAFLYPMADAPQPDERSIVRKVESRHGSPLRRPIVTGDHDVQYPCAERYFIFADPCARPECCHGLLGR